MAVCPKLAGLPSGVGGKERGAKGHSRACTWWPCSYLSVWARMYVHVYREGLCVVRLLITRQRKHVFPHRCIAVAACCTPTRTQLPHKQTSTPTSRTWNDGILSPASLQAHPCRKGSTSDLPSAVLASLIRPPPSQLVRPQLTAFFFFLPAPRCACMLFRFCNRAHAATPTTCSLDATLEWSG